VIIDADCHISSHKFDGLAITADELVEQMDRAAVDRALVWLKPPYDKNIAPENRAVYDAIRRYPDRLIGFGWANPRLGKAATDDAIRCCFEEYGFHGIKFNGAQDDYVIDDPQLALPFVERAARYGKPIAFHIGSDFFENTHPYRLGAIAERFPETPLIMIHMGGASLPTLERAAIETAARHPNITIIGSAIPERALLRAIDALGHECICFGSDMPFRLMHVQLAMYRAMLRDHDEPARYAILGGNIARLLGILEG
jgi:predicted TIM-barrel fold metal-dependent hydrolase